MVIQQNEENIKNTWRMIIKARATVKKKNNNNNNNNNGIHSKKIFLEGKVATCSMILK